MNCVEWFSLVHNSQFRNTPAAQVSFDVFLKTDIFL